MTTKLLEEILSKENLEKACTAVVRNKGASGIDGMKVDELKEYICKHGDSITQKIRQRKYKPLAVRRVQIPKPDGTKRRPWDTCGKRQMDTTSNLSGAESEV